MPNFFEEPWSVPGDVAASGTGSLDRKSLLDPVLNFQVLSGMDDVDDG